jgi:hypothetical protein
MALHNNNNKRKLSEESLELLETNEKKSKNCAAVVEQLDDDNLELNKGAKKNENQCNSQISNLDSRKPICKYGADCYRKNSLHLEQFEHPIESNY